MLADLSGATIQLVDTDGAQGAARGAACGAGLLPSLQDAVRGIPVLAEFHPEDRATARAAETYEQWSHGLKAYLAPNHGELP